MPGGEVFYSPVEDSAEGEITFSEFPAVRFGNEVAGARLVFERGRIVEATAESGEAFLLETLDTDDGARRLGELGIGCNPGIQRFTKNVGFDEKIAGTIHLAIGNSYSFTGRHERQRRPLGHRQGPAERRQALRRRKARAGERRLAHLSSRAETSLNRRTLGADVALLSS